MRRVRANMIEPLFYNNMDEILINLAKKEAEQPMADGTWEAVRGERYCIVTCISIPKHAHE